MPAPKVKSKAQKQDTNRNSKFDEIQKKNLEILKQRVNSYDDDSDEEEVEIDKSKVEALFRNYQGNEIDVARVAQFFESGENIDCLICIRQVKTKDKIWSCVNCYCSFHLLCIQKWANDSMSQKRLFFENQPAGYYSNVGVFIPKKEVAVTWDCPQCRRNYEPVDIPRNYECYCGRERDPQIQPFLIPHSCGEMCNKALEPKCGHRCLLLCHPGPCPPCAQIIHKTCNCSKSEVKTIRCSQQSWTCEKKCMKLLACQVHKCEVTCHETCPPCKKTSVKKCACGSQSKEIKCDQATWSCQKVCKKMFTCNRHFCDRKCHSGDCGNCPYGLQRTCFCGKKTFLADSCEESMIESCGDTCLKPLACGNANHRCYSRCHKGECGACVELVEKKCRCGNLTKEHPCSKELLCETKCKNQKNCKKHACNRKCCIECLPCDKICGKPLSCGKHKCNALCHDGNCYPCMIKQQIKCRCGMTTITVLCGRGKKNRSPKCKEPCRLPSKCHHDPLPHKCHAGDCSNCVQTCDEPLPCLHKCLARCHDYVKIVTKDKNFVAKVPGEAAEEITEMKKLQHPPCATKIPVWCLGGHETTMMQCHEAKNVSCVRACNRQLSCGNHLCKLPCHIVKDRSSEDQDENCEDCESPCTFDRPKGCTHPCPRNQCHQNACKRCHVQVKAKCFCGLTDVYYRCCDVHKRDLDDDTINALKQKYLCCGSRCIKMYSCGHQCMSTCHAGECSEAESCKKKVRLVCKCKIRKIDSTCDKVKAENLTTIACDEQCEAKKRLAEEEKQLELQRQAAIEAEKNRRELEEFEKKIGKKKYKERKQRVVEEKKDNTNVIIAIASVSVIIVGVVLYFTIFY